MSRAMEHISRRGWTAGFGSFNITYLSCTVNEVTFFVLVMWISSKVDLALGRTCGSSPSTQVIHPWALLSRINRTSCSTSISRAGLKIRRSRQRTRWWCRCTGKGHHRCSTRTTGSVLRIFGDRLLDHRVVEHGDLRNVEIYEKNYGFY